MKKLLSLALAVCLVLSLANAAFAIRIRDDEEFESERRFSVFDAPLIDLGYGLEAIDEYTPAYYGDGVYLKFDMFDTVEFDYGKPAPFSDYRKEFKVSYDWEMGEEFIEEVSLRPILDFSNTPTFAIEIKIKDMPMETEENDIIGTVTLKAKKALLSEVEDLSPDSFIDVYDGKTKEFKFDVAFTVSPKAFDEEEDNRTVTDDNMLFTFDDGMEEETLYLYGNMGRFEVNTLGQGDLIISADVDYNKGIEAIDKDHSYVYYNSNGAVFNKIGTLYLSASYGDTLYKVMEDGTLKELKGNYDTDEDAFKLRTRTLGSYVIAEEKLDLEKVNAAILANK